MSERFSWQPNSPSTKWVATTRVLAIGAAAMTLLVAAPSADASKRPNAIVFNIETSQGATGRLTYVKDYEGRRNFAVVEVELQRHCISPDFGTFMETVGVSLPGRTRGNSFMPRSTQNTSTDSFEWSANLRFRPPGRKGGLPRWRRASGWVRAYRAIHDATTSVECDSGRVSFRTTSARRTRIEPGKIVFWPMIFV